MPDETRTCGNCWWWDYCETSPTGVYWGHCTPSLPDSASSMRTKMMRSDHDATRCPCWKKREGGEDGREVL